MKKRMRIYNMSMWVILLAVGICLCMPRVTVGSANSAMIYWQGTTATGAVCLDEMCPLVVEHERLTFTIDEFPQNYYESEEELASYTANVTAQYTFYNPADYDVTATLAFPFGTTPDYLDRQAIVNDTNGYDISVDGRKTAREVRHTYTDGSFYTQTDLARLRDDYMDDKFYALDLPVTKYTFTFGGIESNADNAPYASTSLSVGEETRIAAENMNGGRLNDDTVTIGLFVKNGSQAVVYVLGKSLYTPIVWTVYANGGEKKMIAGSATLSSRQTMTFGDLVFGAYSANSNISRVDWYNATVEKCKRYTSYRSHYIGDAFALHANSDLMRWYTYSMTVPAQTRVVNSVTAPLYPSVDYAYNPPVYGYRYLTSPAMCWAAFGSLDIIVKTPYYIIENGERQFTSLIDGYAAELDGLPNGELEFSLCASPDPLYVRPKSNGFTIVLIVLGLIVAIVCIAQVVTPFIIVVWALVKERKMRKNKTGAQCAMSIESQTQIGPNHKDNGDKRC